MRNPFRYFNRSPKIIRLAVMMYVRYPRSLRQVEDLLFERGIDISAICPKCHDDADHQRDVRWCRSVDPLGYVRGHRIRDDALAKYPLAVSLFALEPGAGEAFMCSGDIGRFDDDGYLYMVGCKKDMIISGGVNIFATDIEAAFITHSESARSRRSTCHTKNWAKRH